MQSTGASLVNELSREGAAAVVVELDWTESVDNPDDKYEPFCCASKLAVQLLPRAIVLYQLGPGMAPRGFDR